MAALPGSPTSPRLGGCTDDDRRRVPVRMGTSHAVFVRRAVADQVVDLRFFTATGELPACGHGTMAAVAFLAARRHGAEHEFRLRVSGRTFVGRAVRDGDRIHAAFDPGPVAVRDATSAEVGPVVDALGVAPGLLSAGVGVGSLGRARLLVPVGTAGAVAALSPDGGRLRLVCDRLGLLGCYVYSTPTSSGRVVARMFAPSIGVFEDIANVNSTACLAVRLAGAGRGELTVEMGDAVGAPSTITASVRPGVGGRRVLVGAATTVDVAGW
ncbi:PhzF family phenazine biosynthesis protein [Micromonospora tarensis]|uniref:PhzF family phenazine biosynthesis protein n=1 Tax=Micromonospora tarensis TaxID=2806100 RepID=A0ABS1YFA0_9ACTN|nr:PhzF family phenazine biosynthesis protein [Micromonospora tarensis]MBM0276098.1 PhzF family phenazine biosynthesis protein [Micromonospora tarensis]